MTSFPIDPKIEAKILEDILKAIESIVHENLPNPEPGVLEQILMEMTEGFKIGRYFVVQIPYASLKHIEFPPLPKEPTEETDRVQRYGPLNKYWTHDPFVKDDESAQDVEKDYDQIPIGFPVQFGQKRYPNEGFQSWRTHNGVKAIRIEYRVFPDESYGRPAHLTMFYSGGDH